MFIRVFIFTALVFFAEISVAQTSSSPATPPPTLEQRVADLEAYVNNSARGADAANAQTISNISGPGPGAMPRHRRPGRDFVVGGRIFSRVFARLAVSRR